MTQLRSIFLLVLLIPFSYSLIAQPSSRDIDLVVAKINMLRSTGYTCGKKYMPPVGPVKWNRQLYYVSKKYAVYMDRYKHFEHKSLDGKDLGDRLDEMGYSWLKIGENLAFGYDNFDEVLEAWKESPSHCTMLLDADVTQMGMSKKGLYWAQSWSKPELGYAEK